MSNEYTANEYVDPITGAHYKIERSWDFHGDEMRPAINPPTMAEWKIVARAIRSARLAELEVMMGSLMSDYRDAITAGNYNMARKILAMLEEIKVERQKLEKDEQ